MQTDEFVAKVNDICPELEPAAATVVCLITIRTLCEYLPKQEADRLSTRLPDCLGRAAAGSEPRRTMANKAGSVENFHEQLIARTEIGYATAQQLTHAVAVTLADALGRDEFQEITAKLPSELGSLFDTEDREHESPSNTTD